MKCPLCETKIESEHYKNDRWARVDKNGEGFYLCPGCNKSLVHRYVISPSFLLFLIAAGALSAALPFVVASFLNDVLGFGEAASDFLGIACYALLIGALCLYIFRPVEVETE